MSDPRTGQFESSSPAPAVPSSDLVEHLEEEGLVPLATWLGKTAGVALLMVTTSTSTVVPVGGPAEWRRETSSVAVSKELSGRRRISLRRACAIAEQALLDAEERRAEFAEEEARRSAVWEEGV